MNVWSISSLAVMAAAVMTVGVGSVPPAVGAQADAQSTVALTIDSGLNGLIAANPGAVKVSASTVRLANGVEATLSKSAPRAGVARDAIEVAGRGCEYEHTCIWNDADYEWSFFHCGFVNIGLGGWSDQVRENENNQTPGTGTVFYNWTGSSWGWVGGDTAYTDTGYLSIYDEIRQADGIDVCNNAPPN